MEAPMLCSAFILLLEIIGRARACRASHNQAFCTRARRSHPWTVHPHTADRFVHKFKSSLEYLARLPVDIARQYLHTIGCVRDMFVARVDGRVRCKFDLSE